MSKIVRLNRFAGDVTTDGEAVSVAATFSDDTVGRDGNIFLTAGMQIDNFLRNPVVPYAHLDNEPPVAKVSSLSKRATQLVGRVTFAPPDLYPFGAMVGRMYRDGFLSAFSVSIIPLEGRYSTDPNRQGGKDVTRSELLEISATPVPALATALVTARSFGMDTSPAAAWAERKLDVHGRSASAVAQLCAIRKAAISPRIHFILGS